MCGGRATRMKSETEKPLLSVNGVPMIERVISALAKSRRFDRIVAVVSQNTPNTKRFLQSKGVETIETAGEGYSQDLMLLLSMLKPALVFVTPADIPLLSTEAVSDIIASMTSGKQPPAISAIIEKKFVEGLGVLPSVVLALGGNDYCHSGITIFDSAQADGGLVEEKYIIMNRMEIAINVNTKEELALAEKLLLVQRAQDLAKDDGVGA
jgi:adenosylcobinamide-phosphate guanylyltransferase